MNFTASALFGFILYKPYIIRIRGDFIRLCKSMNAWSHLSKSSHCLITIKYIVAGRSWGREDKMTMKFGDICVFENKAIIKLTNFILLPNAVCSMCGTQECSVRCVQQEYVAWLPVKHNCAAFLAQLSWFQVHMSIYTPVSLNDATVFPSMKEQKKSQKRVLIWFFRIFIAHNWPPKCIPSVQRLIDLAETLHHGQLLLLLLAWEFSEILSQS